MAHQRLDILEEYKKFKRAAPPMEHAKQRAITFTAVCGDSKQFVALLLNPDIGDYTKNDLVNLLHISGSVALESNLTIVPILAEIYSHRDKLPDSLVEHLDWLREAHGYPLSTQ